MSLNSVDIMGNLTRIGDKICFLGVKQCAVYLLPIIAFILKMPKKITEVSYFLMLKCGDQPRKIAPGTFNQKKAAEGWEGRLRQDSGKKDGKTHSRVRISANSVHFMPKKQNNPAEPDSNTASVDKPAESQAATVISPEDIGWEE